MSRAASRWRVLLRRGLPALLFGGVIALAVFLATFRKGGEPAGDSVVSMEYGGRFVALRLAAELGFEPEIWRDAPGLLPRGRHVLVLAQPPEPAPGYELSPDAAPPRDEEPELHAPALSRRLQDPAHYLRFVEEGGTILATWSPAMEDFLVQRLGLAEVGGLRVSQDPVEEGALLETSDGEELRVEGRLETFPVPEAGGQDVLIADPGGRPFLVRFPLGRGGLALLATDACFRNLEISQGDNALLWVRVLEALDASGRLLFDEYALGGWVPETPLALALAHPYRIATLHLLGLLLLGAWLALRPGPFPRDPELRVRTSALVRARAHGRLLARARGWPVLARSLAREALRSLERGTGRQPADLEESGLGLDPERVDAALAAHARRLGGPEGLARARALLLATDVRDKRSLEAHARELGNLVRALGPSEVVEARRARDLRVPEQRKDGNA